MSNEKRVFIIVGLVIFILLTGLALYQGFIGIPKEKAQRMKRMHERIAVEKIDEENNIYEGVKELKRIFRNWDRAGAEERRQIFEIVKTEFHLTADEVAAMLSGSEQEICYRIVAKKFHCSVDKVRSIVDKKE